MADKKYVLVIHGGVGTILKENMSPEKEAAYRKTLKQSLEAGKRILESNGSAVAAVEAAVLIMEDSPLFNAGKGSVFTNEGKNEMDASIMNGRDLNAGAVLGIKTVKNPISAARKVMEETDHVMLAGDGAEKFAAKAGCEIVDTSYFYTEARYQQLLLAKENNEVTLDHSGANKAAEGNFENGGKKLGTVGAVALDIHGNIAAATSTGGMTNKLFGRIGDTPIIGAGTYADNKTCAISCTGHGEFIVRNSVAYDISALMEYKGLSLNDAAEYVVNDKMVKQNGELGLVGVDSQGNYVMSFNSEGMYRGVAKPGEEIKVEIYK